MRIAIFSESYEPIINGVSVCVSTLREGLVRRGHEVFVFAPEFKGHVDTSDAVLRLPARHTFLMPEYPFPIPFAPAIRRQFASLAPDVVHTQTPFLLGVLGARWARRYGVPFVSTNHTLYTEYAHYVPVRPKALTKWFLKWLMKCYYSGADAVVVPSQPVERILRSYGIKTRIDVIKTGIDPVPGISPAQREEFRRTHGVAQDGFLLLYVGRIAREKNLRMLLTAFATVATSHDAAKLLLVGGGPALAETRQFAASLGLREKVSFAGMLRRDEVAPIYGAADAFVFPSTTETQGIAICEALSAGLPVVAVNAGGIPENLEPGVDSFLTNDDPAEFADRIAFLIDHPAARAEMGTRARANASNFSIDRMAADFERFYESVVAAAACVAEQTERRLPAKTGDRPS
jgi:1,2-diacylglycerol 3-alpha-glucosyltransferase